MSKQVLIEELVSLRLDAEPPATFARVPGHVASHSAT